MRHAFPRVQPATVAERIAPPFPRIPFAALWVLACVAGSAVQAAATAATAAALPHASVAPARADADGHLAALSGAGRVAARSHAALAGGNVRAAELPEDTGPRADTDGPRVVEVGVQVRPRHRAVAGHTLDATVTLSEAIGEVVGTPTLAFALGGQGRQFNFLRFADRALEFRYTLTEADVSGRPGESLGIVLGRLSANVTDVDGNPIMYPLDVDYDRPTVPDLVVLAVEERADDEFMGVEGAYLVDVPANGRYGCRPATLRPDGTCSNTVGVVVLFGEAVVFSPAERVHLVLTVGGQEKVIRGPLAGGQQSAPSSRVTYLYPVVAGDAGPIDVRELRLAPSASVLDFAGNGYENPEGAAESPGNVAVREAVPLRLLGPSALIDTESPELTGVAIGSRGPYTEGDLIEVTLRFTEDVAFDAPPVLAVTLGDSTVEAACAAGAEASTLVCRYRVADGDHDGDGIGIRGDALAGTVTDLAGNPADLGHDGISDDPSHQVFAAPPASRGSLAAVRLLAGGDVANVELGGVFDGTPLGYEASSSALAVAAVSVAGDVLTVRAGVEGSATITVTATNPAGSASLAFGVEVVTDPMETAVLNDALAAIGRGLLSDTTSVIGSRLALRPAPGGGHAAMAPAAAHSWRGGPAGLQGRRGLADPASRRGGAAPAGRGFGITLAR